MTSIFTSGLRPLFTTALALVALIQSATTGFAGTPLICHPYNIGTAKSLPGTDGDWKGINPNYDRRNLVRDTLALLAPETPVLVRMETLRRAAIYATAGMRGWGNQSGFSSEDRANTHALVAQLRERLEHASDAQRALATFDLGFFLETMRHTGVQPEADGYPLMLQARAFRGADAEMEFALALASSWPRRRPELDSHLALARAGARPGTLLAQNLATHFSGS